MFNNFLDWCIKKKLNLYMYDVDEISNEKIQKKLK